MPSPKNARKHQKAVARKKAKRPRPGPKDPHTLKPHELEIWARRVAKWPLRTCVISDWLEHRKQGIVLVARDGALGDVAGALFLVDLGCMGVRDAIRIGPEAPEEFERWLAKLPLRDASREGTPAEALAILEVAMASAERLGFATRPSVAALLPLLGEADPDASFEVPAWGWGGKPLYIEWEDDDAPKVLGRLKESVGSDGFSYVSVKNVVRGALASEDVSGADLATRLARCGELKSMLDLFARFGPFLEERARYSTRVRRVVHLSDEDLPDFELRDDELQAFLHGHRTRDGSSVPEVFIKNESRLTAWDKSVVELWSDMFSSMFRVVEHGDGRAVWESLVDRNRYEVWDRPGEASLRALPVGSFARAWLMAFEDGWLAATPPVGFDDEAYAYELAGAMAYMNPGLMFRNAQLLEQGWQMQREEGQDFEAFFGARDVVVPESELHERLEAWGRYRRDRVVERAAAAGIPESELLEPSTPAIAEELPGDDVGLLHGDGWGLNVVVGYSKFEALFRDPTLIESDEHMDVLDGYVQDESMTPLPFEIVCNRYPEGASKVFAAYLEEPDFDWELEGAEFLRDIKEKQYERGPLPKARPMSSELIAGLKRATARVDDASSSEP